MSYEEEQGEDEEQNKHKSYSLILHIFKLISLFLSCIVMFISHAAC